METFLYCSRGKVSPHLNLDDPPVTTWPGHPPSPPPSSRDTTSDTLRSYQATFNDDLEVALAKDGKSDIDSNELYMELKLLRDFIPEENMVSIEILKFLKRHDYFSQCNYCIWSSIEY